MKKVIVVTSLVIAVLIFGTIFVFVNRDNRRETFQDMKVNIEDEVVTDLPEVLPYCDELDLDARFVNIGDCNIWVEEEGEGVPIVLLHGGPGGTHHDFHPTFQGLEVLQGSYIMTREVVASQITNPGMEATA